MPVGISRSARIVIPRLTCFFWISGSQIGDRQIWPQSTRSLRGSQQRPDAGGVRSRQTRSADIAGSRTQELVTLAVVLAAAVVVWRWVSRKVHQWKEQDRRNTADARSDDEGSDLEAGSDDDRVNPAGPDIEPGATDFLSASADDLESRRSDVDSGSWGVRSRESERSSCSTWMTARTHHNPDDTDSGTLEWAEMAAAVAEGGSLPSDRSVSRNRPEEASRGTISLAMAMSKESRRRSTRSEFDVRHHGGNSAKSSSNNNCVYSQHGESNGGCDGNGDGNDDELDGRSVYHDVLEDALHRARITTGEREGGPERLVANGDLEQYSGSGDGQAARGAYTGRSGGGSSLSTITANGCGPMEGHEEEKEDEEKEVGEEEGDGNVGGHIPPSSHGYMLQLENVNEPEPHLAPTRMDRLIEIFSNVPLMSTAVRDIYIASHCDLDLSATDSNGDLTRERVIGTGYYGRVSRVFHASLGEQLALKELSEEAGDEHRSAAGNEMDAFLSIIYDAACGLQHIHDKGMVHRDIKAANIIVMVNEDGDATGKVADFGLTCEQGERTPPRTGTPGYIPPELVWSGVEAGPENDVFSFGVLMLETFIQPDLWEDNMFVHSFLLSDEERAEFADLGQGNDQAVLGLQFEVMVRTLLDGSFGRQIVQPENLAASVPYRYAVCGWVQACLCQPRHLRPSMASVVEMLQCLKEDREPPPMAMVWYM
ncbi:n/a [Ectocarpus siliculosus]|uniref:N/a n=1 Tax=Ectocarpus siliculosus TaxID=2880 RepID=D7G381_ECTSI|nr:n/a [Ectocarpus siliculosus]|eukprot:CBJ26928.1 n/a [Ectocarpus siliculosus]